MEGTVVFYFVPVKDIKTAKALYRDVLGLVESWREGEYVIAFKLPGTEAELMVEQASEGGPDAAGPILLVPSVTDVYRKYQGKLQFIGEPAEQPDGLWLSAKDDSGNGIYFIDESDKRPDA